MPKTSRAAILQGPAFEPHFPDLAEYDPESVGDPRSPLDHLQVAVVGVGGWGTTHLTSLARRPGTRVSVVCDVDQAIAEHRLAGLRRHVAYPVRCETDVRRVIDDPAVDLITVATPHHWHALAACWALQNGKDVYLEKPVSHNVAEGQCLLALAEEQRRIVQPGLQCRSMAGLRAAIEFVRQGGIGELRLARGFCYKPRAPIGGPLAGAIPPGVDYDLWCGPAPRTPLTRPELHYDWHWFWDTGNGDIGNQGVHQMDLCRWGLGVRGLGQQTLSFGGRWGPADAGETPNSLVSVHDFGQQRIVFEVRGLPTPPHRGVTIGAIVYGADGLLVIDSYTTATIYDPQGNEVRTFRGGGDHLGNFLAAVRRRDPARLNCPLIEGHWSSSLCHLANISWRTGNEVPAVQLPEHLPDDAQLQAAARQLASHVSEQGIRWEETRIRCGRTLTLSPHHEGFAPADQALTPWLSREYRRGFELPRLSGKGDLAGGTLNEH
ncbi:MAG: Gfo/Idh/MocA family oxidoreductase [Pirellulales bacterium]